MSFKLCFFIICIAVASALTIGCAKESVPMREPFVVRFGEKGTCFKNIPDTFQRYFDGKVSDSEVHGFWTCAQSAINTFTELVVGEKSNPDVFTPRQLNRFLTKTFLKDEPLPDSLMASLMDIKTAWFGGSSDLLTKQELNQLKVWFAELDSVMTMLNPHLSVYMGDKDNFSSEELLNAELALINAALKIGSLPERQGKSMPSAQLANFLSELEKYLSIGSDESPMKTVGDMLPMVLTLKKMMFDTAEETIVINDWKNLLATGAQSFMIFRQAKYGVIRNDIEKPLWVRSVDHIASQISNIVLPVFQRRKGLPILEAEWKKLFDEAEKSKLTSFKSNQLMEIYLTVQSLIKAESTANSDFHQEDFINILNEVAAWKNAHNQLLGQQKLNKASAYEAYLGNLLKQNQALQLDKNAEWVIPAQSKTLDIRSQLHINWRGYLLWKLQKKYSDTEDGWTLDQLKPLQKSLSSLFEEKYLVKVFREANLFTLAADGSDSLSATEALQYMSLILSGLSSASRIQDFSKDLSVESVQEAVWNNKAEVFAHTPLFLNYLKDKKTWIKSNQLLMATVKDQGSVKNPWTSWELSQSQILLLYLEGFMKRFDKDQNQVIDHDEALDALKVFGPILGQLLSKIGVGEKELPGFFLFLIRYGDTPFTLYGGDILYTQWRWNPQLWTTIQADRQTLLSILATLAKL